MLDEGEGGTKKQPGNRAGETRDGSEEEKGYVLTLR